MRPAVPKMSTIIHEDQENRQPGMGPFGKPGENNVPSQRTVFGDIHTNKENALVRGGKNKENMVLQQVRRQPLRVTQSQNQVQIRTDDDDEEEKRIARIDAKLKAMSTDSVYKGTAEDRFLTKREVAEMRRKKEEEERQRPQEYLGLNTCPRTAPRKPFQDAVTILRETTKKRQELFFEMDEYRSDIFDYLREREQLHRPDPRYMVKQPDISYSMRTILVDWLVEVAEEYKLLSETLCLAVYFVDRFLSYMSVVRGKLQLVGTSAMFLAAKYEEIYPPEVSEFVYITDDTYNRRQVLRMEQLLLKVLHFDLSLPTAVTFIHAICSGCKLTEKIMYLAMFLNELTMLYAEDYLEYRPSVVAASAVAVARHTIGEPAWNASLAKVSGYELQELTKCITFLQRIHREAPFNKQHAIQDRYNTKKFLGVSSLPLNTKPIF